MVAKNATLTLANYNYFRVITFIENVRMQISLKGTIIITYDCWFLDLNKCINCNYLVILINKMLNYKQKG